MGKKAKKKKTIAKPRPSPVDEGPLAHNPFQALAGLKKSIEPAPPPEPKPEPRKIFRPAAEDEAELFQAAMSEVTPLDHNKGRRAAGVSPRPAPPYFSEDLGVLAHLEDLVSGRAQFDIVDTDEYLEGFVRGIHPIILDKLRRGHFSVQAYLDLHGLTLREAKEAVEDFITEALGLGYRCVLLVHGRGLNSKDQIPVLKRKLETILLKGPVRRKILAFTSARPHDGGAGASYVLLRAKG